MQNFINHRVTARASRQFRRIIMGNTEIVPMDNGDEIRNARWRYKKMKFAANFVLLDKFAQLQIASAFYAANASLMLFRFRDYGDHKVELAPLVDVVPGGRVPVQLTKRYYFGPAHADRIIQAVDSCRVYDDDNMEVAGVYDSELGTFTPTSPWGSGQYRWTGMFSCWVRFASDELDITMQDLELATTDVELLEKRAIRTGGGS